MYIAVLTIILLFPKIKIINYMLIRFNGEYFIIDNIVAIYKVRPNGKIAI